MSIDTRTTVDCRGMRCPAPILEVSRASRKLNGSATTLEVLADDDGFPVDIKAWCRTTGADLASVESSEGIYTALIHLNGKPASAPATAEETAPTPIPAAKASAPKPAAPVAPAASTIEVDCRGMRYDDAERETDYFLDRMLRQGASSAFVLHGHGTGALKTGLRRFLKSDARVKSAKPAAHDDGGDAFTRVELRRSS